ncbi:mitochondrial chaperone bcs1 [Coprinopsis cinerea AmutBmut pab1-1]|nr:mitochondrial chaperone bcs1 [Coprinopsis cinerea AmutBmut pab1-1]
MPCFALTGERCGWDFWFFSTYHKKSSFPGTLDTAASSSPDGTNDGVSGSGTARSDIQLQQVMEEDGPSFDDLISQTPFSTIIVELFETKNHVPLTLFTPLGCIPRYLKLLRERGSQAPAAIRRVYTIRAAIRHRRSESFINTGRTRR